MRKKFCWAVIILLAVTQIFCGCGGNTIEEEKLLRIHVRADSDSAAAQAVKAEAAAAIAYYLDGELGACDTFEKTYAAVQSRLDTIAAVASAVLRSKGYGYGATATLCREYFPEKEYDGKTVASGTYDALIVRLGTGGGDNWWGVLYPQLYGSAAAQGGAVYKSLIAEILRKR